MRNLVNWTNVCFLRLSYKFLHLLGLLQGLLSYKVIDEVLDQYFHCLFGGHLVCSWGYSWRYMQETLLVVLRRLYRVLEIEP